MITHTIIFSLGLGSIMTIIILTNDDFENRGIQFLIGIILLIISTSIFYGISSHYNKTKISEWNDGVCVECGGEYKFKNADNGAYYYACEDCDHVVKVKELKK